MKPLDPDTVLAVISITGQGWTSAMLGKQTNANGSPLDEDWKEFLWGPLTSDISESGANLLAIINSIDTAWTAEFTEVVVVTYSDKTVEHIESGPSNVDEKFQLPVAYIYGFRNFLSRIWVGSPNDSVSIRNAWASI